MKLFSIIKRSVSLIIGLSIVALAVALLKYPTLFGLTTEQVTLVVLALIGIEFLLEKLCYLEHIPDILAKINRLDAERKVFGHRGDFGSTADMIRSAKKKLFISGISLTAMVQHIELLKERAKDGVSIKLMPMDTNPELIRQCSLYLGENALGALQQLDASLRILDEHLRAEYPRLAEIKTLPHRPAFGYAIVDPDDNHGFIRVENYTCKSGMVSRPMMQFRKTAHHIEFSQYYEDFKRLWDLAVRYPKAAVTEATKGK
jgi:hypothetical protein